MLTEYTHQKDYSPRPYCPFFLEMKKYSYIQKSINVLNHIKELKDKNHMAILPYGEKGLS